MEQLEFQENTMTCDDIKEDFKKYFNQNIKKPPSFYEIWMGTDEANKLIKFNEEWEKKHNKNKCWIQQNTDPYMNNNNEDGYGKYMSTICVVKSQYIDKYLKEVKQLCSDTIKLINEYIYGVEYIFNDKIVEYKEPMAINDNSDCIIIDKKGNIKTTDFTIYNSSSGGADYMKAYTNKKITHQDLSKYDISANELYEKKILERKELDKQFENVERNINVDLIGYGKLCSDTNMRQ